MTNNHWGDMGEFGLPFSERFINQGEDEMGRKHHNHIVPVYVPIQASNKVIECTAENKLIDPLLLALLSQPTPHKHEALLHPHLPWFNDKIKYEVLSDELGNMMVDIGKPKTDFRTIFSCHLDTVHRGSFKEDRKHRVFMTSKMHNKDVQEEGMLYAGYTEVDKDGAEYIVPGVLGGDDKIGVYILCKMIEWGIPGRYLFHVGEEQGCIGSASIAKNNVKSVLGHMRRAIAFDRTNYGDVIAHQRGSRCASPKFTEALAKALNACASIPPAQQFKGEVHGASTDTANYVDHISECTNISIAYFDNHGASEHADYVWLENMLLPAIKQVKWEELPTERDKTKKDTLSMYSGGQYQQRSNYGTSYDKIVPVDDLTHDTTMWNVPKIWDPSKGWIKAKSGRVGMEMLVGKWLCDLPHYTGVQVMPFARLLTDLVASNHNRGLEIEELKRTLKERVDGPRFKCNYRLAMLEQMRREWDKKVVPTLDQGIYAKAIAPVFDLNGLSDEDRKYILKIKHVNFAFARLGSTHIRDIRYGFTYGDAAVLIVNQLLLDTYVAIRSFAADQKRLTKLAREVEGHMYNCRDEAVFKKVKTQLEVIIAARRKELADKDASTKPLLAPVAAISTVKTLGDNLQNGTALTTSTDVPAKSTIH